MSDSKPYAPPADFAARAHIKSMDEYRALYERSQKDPESFWAELASKELTWYRPFSKVLEWDAPNAKWFDGGTLNACYNCVDRHLNTPRKNKPALIWEGEPGDQRIITYDELHTLVCRFASVLTHLGYKRADRAVIYMPMIPELPVAMLACARLGITHSVVFGGFSAEALKTRILDLNAQLVITADGGWRRGKEVRLKDAVDDALVDCPEVSKVIVYKRTGSDVKMQEPRDIWWHAHEALESDVKQVETHGHAAAAQDLPSEHPLFV